jgi:hypothetical protein
MELQLKQAQDEQAMQERIRSLMTPGVQALQPPPPQTPPPGQSSQPQQSQQPQPQQPPQTLPPALQIPDMRGGLQTPPRQAPYAAKQPLLPPYTPPQPPQSQQQSMQMGAPPQQGTQGQLPNLVQFMQRFMQQNPGVTGEEAFRVAQRFEPILSQEGKMQLQAALAQNAQLRAEAAMKQAGAAETRAATGAAGEDRRERGAQGATPMAASQIERNQAQAKAALARAGKFNLSGGTGTGTGGGGAGKAGFTDDALDLAAWNYGTKGTLTYRKGKGGPGDPNTAVMNRWGEIAKGLGYTPEELAALPAEFKSDAQSLYMTQKKADAISAQLNSFHNNMKTWDQLAKGIAPSIGGDQAQALAGKLQAINFSDIKSLNEVELRIRQQINDPTAAAYAVGAMAVAMDYARILTGPQSAAQLTEGARNDAQRLISAGLNDDARAAVLGALDSDATGQMKGMHDQAAAIKARMTQHGKGGGSATTAAPKAEAGKAMSLDDYLKLHGQ